MDGSFLGTLLSAQFCCEPNGGKKRNIMKCHFTPTGMTIINTDNDKFGQGNGKLELAHTVGGNVKQHSLFGKPFVHFLKS